MRAHTWLVAACGLCIAFASSVARAESVVLLEVGGDHIVAPSTRIEASRAVAAALREAGVTVVDRATADVPSELRTCRDTSCIRALLGVLRSEAVVAVSLWTENGNPQPAHVSVSFIDAENRRSEHTEAVRSDGLGGAARRAAVAARAQFGAGAGPGLLVRGTPIGAMVSVDGEERGPMPWHGSVAPGMHQVVVSLDGYEPLHRTVHVPTTQTSSQIVEVALAPVHSRAAAASPPRATRDASSPLNYVIAGGLVAVATIPLTAAIRTAIDDGECAGDMDGAGRCDDRVQFDSVSVIQLAAGSALVLGAVTMLVVQPIRIEAEASSEGAMVRIGGTF